MTNADRCKHCDQRLRAVRKRAGKYDALPEDSGTCTQPRSDGWCEQARLPIPDALQWLRVNKVAGFAVTKKDLVISFADRCDRVFTLEDAARAASCTEATARNALRGAGYRYASRPSGRHFFRVYFPKTWTDEQCRAWLDNSTQSGKSRANIYGGKS